MESPWLSAPFELADPPLGWVPVLSWRPVTPICSAPTCTLLGPSHCCHGAARIRATLLAPAVKVEWSSAKSDRPRLQYRGNLHQLHFISTVQGLSANETDSESPAPPSMHVSRGAIVQNSLRLWYLLDQELDGGTTRLLLQSVRAGRFKLSMRM